MSSKLLKSGVLLGGSQVFGQACLLIQSIMLARLLPVSEFAVAAAFTLTITVLDMLRNLGIETQVVQADEGATEEFQAAAQCFLLLRGVFGCILLFLLAGPVARLFNLSEIVWAFRCLAVVPLLGGLLHLDPCRFQRTFQYKTTIRIDSLAAFVGLVTAVSSALVQPTFTSALWGLIARFVVSCVASQVLSVRRYRLEWNPEIFRRLMRFGWPLVVNGFLITLIYQGDRFLIVSGNKLLSRSVFSLADLAVYSVASSVSAIPTTLLANVLTSMLMPFFAGKKQDFVERNAAFAGASITVALVSGAVALPLIFCGPEALRLVYGSNYGDCRSFFAWLAATQAVRTFRIVPTILAMSNADTKNAMWANSVRCISFVIAVVLVQRDFGLPGVAFAGFVGELTSLLLSIELLKRKGWVSVSPVLRGLVAMTCSLFLAGIVSGHWSNQGVFADVAMAGASVMAFLGLLLMAGGGMKGEPVIMLKKLLPKLKWLA